jgi:hypothetical protein
MATNYIVPRIYLLPAGYDLHLEPPYHSFGKALKSGTAVLTCVTRILHEGEIIQETSQTAEYKNGVLVSEIPKPVIWNDNSAKWGDEPGYLEFDIQTADGALSVIDYIGPVSYGTYHARGRKSVFADGPMKYASPPTIGQIAEYGRFVEGQAVVRIDRARDYGESIALINPYRRPILVRVAGSDGRALPRFKVPPFSARYARLANLLTENETSWVGHVQLTATNRIVTFDAKHSLKDPTLFSHFEHLDPFRADPTHMPAFKWLRIKIGWILARRGILLRPTY